MADAGDLKSPGPERGHEGSTPSPGMITPVFLSGGFSSGDFLFDSPPSPNFMTRITAVTKRAMPKITLLKWRSMKSFADDPPQKQIAASA